MEENQINLVVVLKLKRGWEVDCDAVDIQLIRVVMITLSRWKAREMEREFMQETSRYTPTEVDNYMKDVESKITKKSNLNTSECR